MKKTRKKEKGRVGVEIGEGRDGMRSGEKGERRRGVEEEREGVKEESEERK